MNEESKSAASGQEMPAPQDRPIVFFDSGCLLCHRSVRWVIRHDPREVFLFAGLDSDTAGQLIPSDHPLRSQDTVILKDEEGLHGQSEAVFRVLRRVRSIAKILLVFSVLPRSWTNFGYRFIASRRGRWFGRNENCPLPLSAASHRFLN